MNEEKILNRGLEFALEFGPNWLQPIHSRLSDKFPELKSDELNKYDTICRTAMRQGHDYIYNSLTKATDENRKVKEKEIAEDLKNYLHRQYAWIDSGNLKRILSQGFYYAWRDGLDKCISS
jgi:hypothetical protein